MGQEAREEEDDEEGEEEEGLGEEKERGYTPGYTNTTGRQSAEDEEEEVGEDGLLADQFAAMLDSLAARSEPLLRSEVVGTDAWGPPLPPPPPPPPATAPVEQLWSLADVATVRAARAAAARADAAVTAVLEEERRTRMGVTWAVVGDSITQLEYRS